MLYLDERRPLLRQLRKQGFEMDQRLMQALEVSASRPDLGPEDVGFPDSYLTLALYRLNSVLTRVVSLDESRYNLFHEYKLAEPCKPEQVKPGRRLAGVLEKASEFAAPSKTIGTGHYLRAVVHLTLDQCAEPAWGFRDQVLHNTFSAETLLWGLGHTAWTPVEMAPELSDVLGALDGRHEVDDVQYMMSLEQGRMVFRPTSILDPYQLDLGAGEPRSVAGVLTHFRDSYAAVTPDEILELEDLINSPSAREQDFQSFFEAHQQFLRIWDYRQVYPHVYLTREEFGPLVPDFLLVDPALQRSMAVELKLPSARTVTRSKNRDRFSALIGEARAQLLAYRDWFEDTRNREAVKAQFGLEVFRPRLGVIIGRAADFRSDIERQRLASQTPDLEIVTYDDIVRHAERRLALVKSASRFPA